MWTVLGYPACAAAFPLMVGETDILPDYVKPDAAGHSQLCDIAMDLKSENVFKWNVSNGSHYMDMESVVKGRDGRLRHGQSTHLRAVLAVRATKGHSKSVA